MSDYYLEEFCVTLNECPADCICHGTVVDCRNQNLQGIPFNIPSYTTEL
jgi:hypothetical protein